jgi:hypothetical protein
MDVFRHDHVPANRDVEISLSIPGKLNHRLMNRVTRQPFLAPISAKSHELERTRFKQQI